MSTTTPAKRSGGTAVSPAQVQQRAVQKIFQEHHLKAKQHAPASPPWSYEPPSRHGGKSGDSQPEPEKAAVVGSGGPSPVPKHSVEAVTGKTLAGPVRPDWKQVDSRGLNEDGLRSHLNVTQHLSHQFGLAVEMGMGVDGEGKGGTKTLLHYEDFDKPGDPRVSHFSMTLAKSKHQLYLPSTKEPLLLHEAGATMAPTKVPPARSKSAAQQRRAQKELFHRQQVISRYEETLPLRRAADPYKQLTAAQLDARVNVPTTHTRQVLSERYQGNHPIANSFHQELYRGEPLLRQILRGDFYDDGAETSRQRPRGAAARSASTPATTTRKGTDFIKKNKWNVRQWSDGNSRQRYAAMAAH